MLARMYEAQYRKEQIALTLLVNRVYQIHSRRVLAQYGWRCARCGRTYLLQIHHRQFRSHGGTHRPENLEPVCGHCHRLIHGHERSLHGIMTFPTVGKTVVDEESDVAELAPCL